METVLIMSDRLKLTMPQGIQVVYPESRTDLARRLVRETEIRCLVLDFPEIGEENRQLLLSIKEHFPVLSTAVILPEKFGKDIPDYLYLETKKGGGRLKEELGSFIRNSRNSNKREAHRFTWPLTARFSSNGEERDLEIYSVSSGGAFLKAKENIPAPGTIGQITVYFNKSELASQCLVTGNQGQSSKMPFGFGVKFTSLTPQQRDLLNNTVHDAIIALLLDPFAEPGIPTLGNEGLDEEDPFSL